MHTITTVGLDIAKSVFQVHGIDAEDRVIIRRQLKRRYVLAETPSATSTATEPSREMGCVRASHQSKRWLRRRARCHDRQKRLRIRRRGYPSVCRFVFEGLELRAPIAGRPKRSDHYSPA